MIGILKQGESNSEKALKPTGKTSSVLVYLYSTKDFYNSRSEQNLWAFLQPGTLKLQLSGSITRSVKPAVSVLKSAKEPLSTLKTVK